MDGIPKELLMMDRCRRQKIKSTLGWCLGQRLEGAHVQLGAVCTYCAALTPSTPCSEIPPLRNDKGSLCNSSGEDRHLPWGHHPRYPRPCSVTVVTVGV